MTKSLRSTLPRDRVGRSTIRRSATSILGQPRAQRRVCRHRRRGDTRSEPATTTLAVLVSIMTFPREIQEVRGARNAGVVIANRLFTAPLQFLIVEGESVLHNSTQVVFDAELILRRRRHDSGPADDASSSMSYWWSRRPRGASVVAVRSPLAPRLRWRAEPEARNARRDEAPRRTRRRVQPRAPRCFETDSRTVRTVRRRRRRREPPRAGVTRSAQIAPGTGEVSIAPVEFRMQRG